MTYRMEVDERRAKMGDMQGISLVDNERGLSIVWDAINDKAVVIKRGKHFEGGFHILRNANKKELEDLRIATKGTFSFYNPEFASSERGMTKAETLAYSLSGKTEEFAAWMKERPGVEDARVLPNGKIRIVRGGIAKTHDPTPGNMKEFIKDLPNDILDTAWDTFVTAPLAIAAEAAGFAAGGPAGPVLGSAAAGGVGGISEFGRQALGRKVGVRKELSARDMGAVAVAEGVGVPIGRGTNWLARKGGKMIGDFTGEIQALGAGLSNRPGAEAMEDIFLPRVDAARRIFGEGNVVNRTMGRVNDATGLPINPRIGRSTKMPLITEAAQNVEDVIEGLTNNRLIPEAFEVNQQILMNPNARANVSRGVEMMYSVGANTDIDGATRKRAVGIVRELIEDQVRANAPDMPEKQFKALVEEILNNKDFRVGAFSNLTVEQAISVKRRIQFEAFKREPTTGVRVKDAAQQMAKRAQYPVRMSIEKSMGGSDTRFAKALAKQSEKEMLLHDLGAFFGGSDPKGIKRSVGAAGSMLAPANKDMLAAIREADKLFARAADGEIVTKAAKDVLPTKPQSPLNLELDIRRGISGLQFDLRQTTGGMPQFRPHLGATGAPVGRQVLQGMLLGGAIPAGAYLTGQASDNPWVQGAGGIGAILMLGSPAGSVFLKRMGRRLIGDPLRQTSGAIATGLSRAPSAKPYDLLTDPGNLLRVGARSLAAEKAREHEAGELARMLMEWGLDKTGQLDRARAIPGLGQLFVESQQP